MIKLKMIKRAFFGSFSIEDWSCATLLKKAFAVAKSGLPYDENYRSVKPGLN